MAAQASPVCANPAPEALEIVNQVNEILNSLNETHPLFLSRQEKEKPWELRDFYEQILKSDRE